MSGYSNTLHGSVKHLVALLATTVAPTFTKYEAIGIPDCPIYATPATAGATEIYSRNKAPKNVTGLYQGDQFKVNGQPLYTRIVLDGTQGVTPLTSDDFPSLINLVDIGADAALAADEKLRLRNVVLMNGIPLTPAGNDATLAAGEFQVVDNGGVLELYVEKTVGVEYGAGTCLEIHMDPSNTQITTTAIASGQAGVPHEAVGAHFWTCDANVVLHRDPA